MEFHFKVKGVWRSDRSVACRVAMCIGVGDPLAWNDGDEGAPFWHEDDQKWQLNYGNDYWLRRIDNAPGELPSVRTFKLTYRYSNTPERMEALQSLCKWLECDLVFGI